MKLQGIELMKKITACLSGSFLGFCLLLTPILAQDSNPTPEKEPLFTFSGSNTIVSKYISRGWRLTDGWSMQPEAAVSFKGFTIDVWGNLDLTAVNEGDSDGLKLAENPSVPPGTSHLNGMKGRFSEIDYTFSYSREIKGVEFTGGTLTYVYPDRASFPSSTDVFFGASIGSLPLSPSATLYVDVDETQRLGKTGLYLEMTAAHSFALPNKRFSSLDLSGILTVTNTGYARYYYGITNLEDGRTLHGFHDFNITATLPCKLNDSLTMSFFGAYSSLLGPHREVQYANLKDVYLNRAESPSSRAGTWWGGITFAVSF